MTSTMTTTNLNEFLDTPGDLLFRPPAELESISRRDIETFQLEAARRKLERQADRIPAVGDILNGKDPSAFECFDDFAPVLFDEDVYKSYDPAWIEHEEFARLTQWINNYTSHDLSGVDMEGCDSLTEWCRRIDEQADIFICHSSGTSGVLSFVPRSQRDRDWVVDNLVWSTQPLFNPHRANDVTYFCMYPRRQYRITQALYDGLEQRYQTNPTQALIDFSSPEFSIAQGKLRVAAANGTMDTCLKNPIVAAYRDEVERYQRDLPKLIERWTDNLIENYRGKRIYFQGSFDRAWQITQYFKNAGVTGAFSPESIFSLYGGVKDGSKLPDDWQEQFRRAIGVEESNLVSGWGMSELTGSALRCPQGMYHFTIQSIPFLLEPKTRKPLPRKGVQTGQFAMLEVNSEDCWGGMISGDRGTIYWDRTCACGRDGPLLDPDSVSRL
jgi:hypothetical protein